MIWEVQMPLTAGSQSLQFFMLDTDRRPQEVYLTWSLRKSGENDDVTPRRVVTIATPPTSRDELYEQHIRDLQRWDPAARIVLKSI